MEYLDHCWIGAIRQIRFNLKNVDLKQCPVYFCHFMFVWSVSSNYFNKSNDTKFIFFFFGNTPKLFILVVSLFPFLTIKLIKNLQMVQPKICHSFLLFKVNHLII